MKRSGCHRQRRKQALGWRRFRPLAGQTVVPEAEGWIAEILLSAEGRSGQAAGQELVNQGVPLRCRAMDAGCGFHGGAPVRVEGPGQPSGPDGIRLERAGTSGYICRAESPTGINRQAPADTGRVQQ